MAERHGIRVDGTFLGARSRRGARRLWRDFVDADHVYFMGRPGDLLIERIERRRVVDVAVLPASGDPPPDAGVREPRRPRPAAGGAAAAADPQL